MNQEAEKIAVKALSIQFNLPTTLFDEVVLSEFRKLLIERLEFLINHDFEKLLDILYRIDVDENGAKKALLQNSEMKPSEVFADLIIARQMQKVLSRGKFSS